MAGDVADSNISAHSHISPYLVWSLLTMTPFPDTHGKKLRAQTSCIGWEEI